MKSAKQILQPQLTRLQKKFPIGSSVRVLPAGAFAVSYDETSQKARAVVCKIGKVYANDGMFITVRFGGPLDPEIIFHEGEIERTKQFMVCLNCKLDLDLCECPSFDNVGNEL